MANLLPEGSCLGIVPCDRLPNLHAVSAGRVTHGYLSDSKFSKNTVILRERPRIKKDAFHSRIAHLLNTNERAILIFGYQVDCLIYQNRACVPLHEYWYR